MLRLLSTQKMPLMPPRGQWRRGGGNGDAGRNALTTLNRGHCGGGGGFPSQDQTIGNQPGMLAG